MPLVSCPECKREVSSGAASCPGCGHQLRKALSMSDPVHVVGVVLVAVCFLAVVAYAIVQAM